VTRGVETNFVSGLRLSVVALEEGPRETGSYGRYYLCELV